MTTIRYKPCGKKWAVYELNQYWDKELKKPRQKQKYLGMAEEKGGPYTKVGVVAAPKVESEILDCGDSYAINEVSKSIGLSNIISSSFGNLDTIMSLICFQITEGAAMYNCEDWIDGNIAKKLFPRAKISSQDISRIIKTLGRQDLQRQFFTSYIAKFFPNECGLLIDSTALPSAINSSINAYGYSDGLTEQNVGCLMLVEKTKKLPIYFRAIGGDIADISTLQTTVAEIKQLGLSTDSAILDAGFCSKENLKFMCAEKINFVTRLPRSHKIFGKLVEAAAHMESKANAVVYGERAVFVKSQKVVVYGNEIYVHVILDPSKRAKDMNMILKNSDDDKPKKKEQKEIDSKLNNAGYVILLSRQELERNEVLPSYYTRQTIEQVFGFAKSNNNLLPLRVHDEQSIKGYLMLVFLALIVFITMRQKLQMPMDKALLGLRSLKAKVFEDEIVVQEVNRKNKDLFKALGIIMPMHMGI